jgi:hypothetical protein
MQRCSAHALDTTAILQQAVRASVETRNPQILSSLGRSALWW